MTPHTEAERHADWYRRHARTTEVVAGKAERVHLPPRRPPAERRPINSRDIKAAVCEHFAISLIEMTSHRRRREVARPRQIAMALCYELTPLSLPKIGNLFGNRDHTTVMHAVRQIGRLCIEDAAVAADVSAIRAALKAG